MSKSPSVRYFEKILFPLLKNFGVDASVKINNEGYYPWGGGEAEIEVEPVKRLLKENFLNKTHIVERKGIATN